MVYDIMTMKNTREDDYFYDSDDELPSLDTLLARLPGRIQQQLSPSKPTSYPSLKNTTLIELDDGNSSAEDHTTDKADSFLDLSDAAPEQVIPPLVKGRKDGRDGNHHQSALVMMQVVKRKDPSTSKPT
ncbi:hypothetical protein TrVFT333_003747 [Trichoderma virens FT-333]|nr:hypothetical protein TrVFT333_003747 [Trichoderma virens FT-333]